MELDESAHPVTKTSFRFADCRLITENNDSYRVNIVVEIRSFLPGEPFQTLGRVAAEIIEGKNTFAAPADVQSRYRLENEVSDPSGQARLFPFTACLLTGITLNGSVIELQPLPELRMSLPRTEGDDALQRVWGEGFAFRDLRFSMTQFATSRSPGTDSATAAPAHIYRIQVDSNEGHLLTFPGENTLAHEVGRDLVARGTGRLPEEPAWVRHPDHCLRVPAETFNSPDHLHRRYVALCALLKTTTGLSPRRVSILTPVDDHHVDGRFCLFGENKPNGKHAFRTIPFDDDKISLAELLERCWPRVEHLLGVGFNFVALSGWYCRGSDLEPIQQGILNLFVYLECLKAHWRSARLKIPPEDLSSGFEGHVNSTLKELLGRARRIGRESEIHELTELRDRIVHEGVVVPPGRELVERYCRLHTLCSAAYLSLIGWEGKWNVLRAPNSSAPRTTVEDAWWKPPNLKDLLPPP